MMYSKIKAVRGVWEGKGISSFIVVCLFQILILNVGHVGWECTV